MTAAPTSQIATTRTPIATHTRRSFTSESLDTLRSVLAANYRSGDDFVVEFLGHRFEFSARDFEERVIAAAVRIEIIGSNDVDEQEAGDLVELVADGRIGDPRSGLGLYIVRHWEHVSLQNGESLAYVKEQMGHHSIKVTVDIYGKLVPGANKAAVDRLDAGGRGAEGTTSRNPPATDFRKNKIRGVGPSRNSADSNGGAAGS